MSETQVTGHPAIPGFSYVRPLGSGGFAKVYLYEQDMPRRVVAVKVLNRLPEGGGDGESLRAVFEREADVMARLSSHPSIVSIYQASISLDGLPYLAMEYCPDSMGARTNKSPAPLQVVLDTGVRMAGALETAHRAGVLHRDIKPSNVLITTLGRPVLADFGISHVVGQQMGESQETAMSIPWSAPEVVRLGSTGTVQSEVWSLAATLYTFAAGRSPFVHRDREQNSRSKLSARIAKAAYAPIPSAQGYEPFDRVLAAAMRKRPEDRFHSMAQFGEALQELQRQYGYDVTPLEVISEAWIPGASSAPVGSRGPVVSAVGRTSRAEARAALAREERGTDKDGVLLDRPGLSPGKVALIGAGAGVGVILIGAAVLWSLMGGGW